VTRALVRYFVTLTSVAALVGYVAVYGLRFADQPIRSDGFSYYVYLPSWFLYGDPTLERVARDCCGGTFPVWTNISRWPETGRWVDAHPIGDAVLMIPFFAAATALSWWSNLPRDGFSLYYQHFAGLAGLVYFVAGLAVLRRLLQRHFSDGIVLATLVTITFGTNLFHYGTYDSIFSHAYSFFLITALVALTERWWEEPRWPISLALGSVSALIVLTRHPNVIFLALIPLYGVTSWSSFVRNLRMIRDRRASVAGMIAIAVFCTTPQLAIYKRATGHWLISSYGLIGHFTFASPHLVEVLVGVQKGLLFWSPALGLAVAGMFVARGWARGLIVATVVILALDTYLIASWWDWQFGGSYGHRAFVDSFGLLAIFMASFFAWAAERPRVMPVVEAVAGASVVLSLVQMFQYWRGIIPISDMTWDRYRDIFLRFR
jgi:hypothetical protein